MPVSSILLQAAQLFEFSQVFVITFNKTPDKLTKKTHSPETIYSEKECML